MISTSIKAKREAKGWSKKYLGDLIGVSSAAIGQYEKGDNRPKVEVLLKLNKVFEYDFINNREIDLSNEKGDQLSQKSNIEYKASINLNEIKGKQAGFSDIGVINSKLAFPENSTFPLDHKNTPTANTENKGVPYYDIDFMGGFDLVFNSQQIQPSFYIDFLPFNDCDCWINVTGKSMGPMIAHGDIVGLKKVDNWKRFLLEGEIYAVITDNGFRTIKMLGAGPDKEHYTLIPYNKSDEYQPQVIPKDVITHIFRVKGNIKKFF